MSERIKIIYTYTISLIVIVGGGVVLYVTRNDPNTTDVQGLRLLLAGFIGSALTFVFGRETASGAAFQSERAYAAGLATPTLPTMPTTVTTTSEGPPATSTTTTIGDQPPSETDVP